MQVLVMNWPTRSVKQKNIWTSCWLFQLSILIMTFLSDLGVTEAHTHIHPGLSGVDRYSVQKYPYSVIALICGGIVYRLSGHHEPLDISSMQLADPDVLQLLESFSGGDKVPEGIDPEEDDFPLKLPDNDNCDPEEYLDSKSFVNITGNSLPEMEVTENAGQYTSTVTGIIACPRSNTGDGDSGDGDDEESEESEQDSETETQMISEEVSEILPDQDVINGLGQAIRICDSDDEAREIVKEIRKYNTEELASGILANVWVNNQTTCYRTISLFYLACRQGYINIVKALYHPEINLEQTCRVFSELS